MKPKTPEVEDSGQVIAGAFACMVCHYQVDEASWFPTKKLLAWTCPEGHESSIKDFKGF